MRSQYGPNWEHTPPEPEPPTDAELLGAWRDWAINITGAGFESDELYRDHIDWLLHYHRIEDDGNSSWAAEDFTGE
jgi:hypothetical protein